MCRRVTCGTCGKPTYAGCGSHIEQVLANVPRSARCQCRAETQGKPGAPGALGRVIDRIPLGWLAVFALLMALLPVTPQPHLLEKLRMLADGTLHRPIDIFDLLFHGVLPLLLGIRLLRMACRTGARASG